MSSEKKLFVDEDWKSQVEAEKAALARDPVAGSSTSSEVPELPAASFELLVTIFVTEAMVALGQIPNPLDGKSSFSPEHARYAIDMLQVIQAKTSGNLSPDEAAMLESLLHQLRLAFVSVTTGSTAL